MLTVLEDSFGHPRISRSIATPFKSRLQTFWRTITGFGGSMTPSSDNVLLVGRYSAKANKLTVCGPVPNIAGRAIPIKFSLREAKNIMADGRSHTFVGSRGTHLRSLAKGITGIAFFFGCGVFFSGCMVNFTDPL